MKHLLLSTSLIVATAVPAFSGTEAAASGSAGRVWNVRCEASGIPTI